MTEQAASQPTAGRGAAGNKLVVSEKNAVPQNDDARSEPVSTTTQAIPASATAASGKPPFEIPPMLLEGDEPSPFPVATPESKYAPGPPPATVASAPPEHELPEAYGTGRLLLTARDPRCLYAHWDLTSEQQRGHNALALHHHLTVRVHAHESAGPETREIHVNPEARHCFIPVERGGMRYTADLGYYRSDGEWRSIAASEPVATPPEGESSERTIRFATIRPGTPLRPTAAHARGAVSAAPAAKPGQVPGLEPLRVEGIGFPRPIRPWQQEEPNTGVQRCKSAGPEPDVEAAAQELAAPGEWSANQERALSEAMGPVLVRREWLGSAGIEELISWPVEQEVASMAAAQFGIPGAGAGVSSPSGGAMPEQEAFWLNVNAELVVYGATEPSAWVTIGGRTIRLRPDGTFSYRFALPDGNYELPIAAVSMSGELRQAELEFQRRTRCGGEVGAHPQDPALKAPGPENAS